MSAASSARRTTSWRTASGAERLAARGILWAPDFVVNAGGVIFLSMMSERRATAEATQERVERIGDTVARDLRAADERGITTLRGRRGAGARAPAGTSERIETLR